MKIAIKNIQDPAIGFIAIELPDNFDSLSTYEAPSIVLQLNNESQQSYLDNLRKQYPFLVSEPADENKIIKIKIVNIENIIDVLSSLIIKNYIIDNQFKDLLTIYLEKINIYRYLKNNFQFATIVIPDYQFDSQGKLIIKDAEGNRPYISFTLDHTIIGLAAYNWYLCLNGDYGLLHIEHDVIKAGNNSQYIIYGKHAVCYMIDQILKLQGMQKHKCLPRELLLAYQSVVNSSIKPIEKIPPQGIRLSDLQEISIENIKASHSIKKFQDKSGNIWYIKFNPSKRKGAEYEAANSWVHKLFLNDKATISCCVYDNNNERIGVASLAIADYRSLADLYDSHDFPSERELIVGGLGGIQMVAGAFHNADMNLDNIGYVKKLLREIDYDRVLWELTATFSGYNPNKTVTVTEVNQLNNSSKIVNYPAPKTAFPATINNILRMPYAGDIKPTTWLTNNTALPINWAVIADDADYQRDVRRQAIMISLAAESIYQHIADETFSSVKANHSFVKTCTKISQEYQDIIINNEEFRNLIINDISIENEVIAEFEKYNKNCKVDLNRPEMCVDLDELKKNYNNLKRCCSLRQDHLNNLIGIIRDLRKLTGNECIEVIKNFISRVEEFWKLLNKQGSTDENNVNWYLQNLLKEATKVSIVSSPMDPPKLTVNKGDLQRLQLWEGFSKAINKADFIYFFSFLRTNLEEMQSSLFMMTNSESIHKLENNLLAAQNKLNPTSILVKEIEKSIRSKSTETNSQQETSSAITKSRHNYTSSL